MKPGIHSVFLFAAITQGTALASTTAFISLDAVALFVEPAHTQNVNLFDTLGNTYVSAQQWQHNGSVMLGLGLRTYQRDGLNVNTSLRFMPVTSMPSHGDVLQLYSPRFRNLTYTYDITSNLLLVDNVMTLTRSRLQPGLIVGLGRASNTTANYREVPISNHATQGLDYFSGNTRAQFAYELGAVLDYSFNDVVIECAYRYIDAGRGQLGLSPTQNTMEHLSTGPIHYHAISLGVRFDHAL